MKALFITADGLEFMQEVPDDTGHVLMPVSEYHSDRSRELEEAPKPREYRKQGMRDGVAVFREVSAA